MIKGIEDIALCLIAQEPSFFDKFVNWLWSLDPFSLTLLFLLVATIVGTILKGRSRDRCYKQMEGFDVVLVLEDREFRGILDVGNAGMETSPGEPPEGPFARRTGFLLPKSEYGGLRMIYRIPGDMDGAMRRRRDKLLRRVTRPGLFRLIGRRLSNLAGSFKDAFTEFFSLVMGRLTSKVGGLKSQKTYVDRMEKDVSSTIPNSNYDAILEKLRGKHVEIEIDIPDHPRKLSAILGDYTANNLAVFDARLPEGEGAKAALDKADVVLSREFAQVRYRLEPREESSENTKTT
jgi:hypothetical protein